MEKGQAVTLGPTAFAATAVAGSGLRRSVSNLAEREIVAKSVKILSSVEINWPL